MEMVGVGQLDLRSQFVFQIQCADTAFDGGLCAYVHEHRRLYLAAVGAGEHAAPRVALFLNDLEHSFPPVNV